MRDILGSNCVLARHKRVSQRASGQAKVTAEKPGRMSFSCYRSTDAIVKGQARLLQDQEVLASLSSETRAILRAFTVLFVWKIPKHLVHWTLISKNTVQGGVHCWAAKLQLRVFI